MNVIVSWEETFRDLDSVRTMSNSSLIGVNPTNLMLKDQYVNSLRKLRNKYETLHIGESG